MARPKKIETPSVVESNPLDPRTNPVSTFVGIERVPGSKLYRAVAIKVRGNLVIDRTIYQDDFRQGALDKAHQEFAERFIVDDF